MEWDESRMDKAYVVAKSYQRAQRAKYMHDCTVAARNALLENEKHYATITQADAACSPAWTYLPCPLGAPPSSDALLCHGNP